MGESKVFNALRHIDHALGPGSAWFGQDMREVEDGDLWPNRMEWRILVPFPVMISPVVTSFK